MSGKERLDYSYDPNDWQSVKRVISVPDTAEDFMPAPQDLSELDDWLAEREQEVQAMWGDVSDDLVLISDEFGEWIALQ